MQYIYRKEPVSIFKLWAEKQRLTGVAHLPFEPYFGREHSQYPTKNELAQGYKNWVRNYNIVRNQFAKFTNCFTNQISAECLDQCQAREGRVGLFGEYLETKSPARQ
jgi:hypothetical protein